MGNNDPLVIDDSQNSICGPYNDYFITYQVFNFGPNERFIGYGSDSLREISLVIHHTESSLFSAHVFSLLRRSNKQKKTSKLEKNGLSVFFVSTIPEIEIYTSSNNY